MVENRATDGMIVLAGAFEDDNNGSNSESAYVFAVGGDCDHNSATDACEIVADPNLDLNNNGSLDQCEDSDGDGIPDEDDACPESDLAGSIVIDECDSEHKRTL